MMTAPCNGQASREELERVLSSACFVRSEGLSRLLRFLVERQLEGRAAELKESLIGVEVYGRRPDYDPKLDSTVRSEAVRLRARLGQYYSTEGAHDPMVIELPKGGYVPTFRQHEPARDIPQPQRNRRWIAVGSAGFTIALAAAVCVWLVQADYFWKNPLEGARVEKLTDWESTELDASISLDGNFVSFVADRDGPYDIWITQIGSGEFRNLTQGHRASLLHETSRSTGFSADGSHVWLITAPSISLVPTLGGAARVFLAGRPGRGALNPIWSPDRKHLAFHYASTGDPIMVADPDGQHEKQIFVSPPGEHNHYLAWSPDQRFLYFVRGQRATEMDVWRISPDGGTPEQITHQNSDIAYPVLIDNRTLLYRATRDDGGGWALYGMDVEHRIPHRISSGLEEYQSIAASTDGRRLVVTVSNPVLNLWKVPIADRVMEEADAQRIRVPAAHAKGGRYGRGYLLYLSGKGGENGLWKWDNGSAVELWKGNAGAVLAAPALSPNGNWMAFAVRRQGRSTLYVATTDGSGARPLAESLAIRSAPSWSPDGQWIAVAADAGQGSRIYKVPVERGLPVQLTERLSFGPVWSPDGTTILYADATDGGAVFPIRAVRPDKTPVPIPDLRQLGDYESFRFAPDGSVIILAGANGPIAPAPVVGRPSPFFRAHDFWRVDLTTASTRRLTQLKKGFSVRSFDVSADGREILFDRILENSDLVLFERQ